MSSTNHRTVPAVKLTLMLVALLSMAVSMFASSISVESVPVSRVTSRVDNSVRSTLTGHIPPQISGAQDLGRLDAGTPMNHMIMVLAPSAEQDHAMRTLIDQQLDKTTPYFHKWLTPEEVGASYGVADSDIAAITGWLTSQGMTIDHVGPSKRFIQFSGNAGQVESAFATEMHSFNVNGKAHVSNNSEISIPAALQPVIRSVPTLNNFFKSSGFQQYGTVADRRAHPVSDLDEISEDATNAVDGKFYFADHFQGHPSFPDYTSGSTHFVGAGDFAAIYNTTPLISGGFDGTGVSIGIIGRTDIDLTDVQVYRTMFGLKPNDPTFIVAGEDPGIVGGDDGESYLDVEVSGGAAPGAAVKFISSRATLTTDGVDLSAMYAVENNLTDIISESYGQCEANFTPSALSFYSNLWGEAAAQGQSVFVSSGDNGPAACDGSNSTFSSSGYAVSALASSPFNVAVGGTLFADTAANWGTTSTTAPPFASALGYIPEVPWNEAKASGAVGAAGLWSGSGGISAYTLTPPWQHGFGVPLVDPAYPNPILTPVASPTSPFVPGPHRYMPDVAMAAAAQHDGTLTCSEGICQLSSTGSLVNAGITGGTSVAAPSMAGIQALVDQVNGGRQGIPNYVYYSLADAQHTAGLNCAANAGSVLDANCAFRDITTGNTLVCRNSACTAADKIGWTAAAGYDMATGLGSPNAQKLANLWNTVTFRSTTTTMSPSQTTGIAHGQSVLVTGTVAPGSGTGVPTGTVALVTGIGGLGNVQDPNTGAFLNPVPTGTLDGSGNYSINITNLPAGTYSLVARYGGDGTFASSTSAPVTVTVGMENSTVTISPNAFNQTTCLETPATTFVYGSYVWTDVTVAGTSEQGVPTGTVSVTDNGNPLTSSSLNAVGLSHFLSGAIPTTSCVFGYSFQDSSPLTVGSHTLGASYSGDATFGPANATPVAVTITPATLTGALTSSSTNISSGGSVQLTLTVAGLTGAGPGTASPTGTVTFTDTTTAASVGTAVLSPTATFGGRAILSTTAITTAGANSITASWPGDTNYTGITSAALTVTVQGGTATSLAVTSNTNPSIIGGRPTWTATMTPTTVTSGTVNFYDSNVLLGAGTVGAAHTATFRPAATVNLPAGVHSITAVFAGNATFNSSVSPAFSQTFTQAGTTTTLTVKLAGAYGQTYALSALLGTVQAATPPSGTFQFFDGANPIGSPQPITTVSTTFGGFGLFQAQLYPTFTAGTHVITAQLTDPNYTSAVSNSQTIVVSQASPAMTVLGGTFTYDGNPHAGSGTAKGGGGESLAVTLSYVGTGSTTYGPTSTAPTGAGTYTVTAHTAGDTNNAAGDSAPVALTINKATPTLIATGFTHPYTGLNQSASGTATGGDGSDLLSSSIFSYVGTGSTTYGPSPTGPSGVGTYQATLTFPGDPNNNSGSSSPASITITQAAAVVSATGGSFTYDGSPHAGSGTATGIVTGGSTATLMTTLSYTGTGSTTYGPTSTAPTGAGTYQVVATTTGDANNSGGSSSAAALTIAKGASATNASVTGTPFTYNGAPHGGSGTATGAAGESLTVSLSYVGTGSTTYGPSSTAPTGAGAYTVTASTVGDANNNGGSSSAVAFTINKATPTMTAVGGLFTDDGNPHAGSGTATSGDNVTSLPVTISYSGTGATSYGPTATAPTASGTYLVTVSTVGDLNNNPNSATAPLSIGNAITSIAANVGSVNGGLAVTITGNGFETGATVTIGGNAATNVIVVSGTTITATTPAGTLGAQDVVVTNLDTSTGVLSDGFTYVAQLFDPNGDSVLTPLDINFLVNFLFEGGAAPASIAAGDANLDGVIDPADIFFLVNALFLGGPMPQAKTPTPVMVDSVGSLSGSIMLGTPVFNSGRYLIPVIVNTTAGSALPQAMSLRFRLATEGTVGSVTVMRDGEAKGMKPSFEASYQSGNDVSYLVSFSGTDALGGVVAQISVPAFEGQRIAVSVDPTLTMLTDRRGMIKASVAGQTLTVGGTTIGDDVTPTTRVQN